MVGGEHVCVYIMCVCMYTCMWVCMLVVSAVIGIVIGDNVWLEVSMCVYI